MAIDPMFLPVVASFAREAQALCEKCTRALLQLERGAGEALEPHYESLARALHTLKGTAGTLGMEDLGELAHAMEDLVAPVREARLPVPSQAADSLFAHLELYLQRLDVYVQGGEPPEPIGPSTEALRALVPLTEAAARGEAASPAAPQAKASSPSTPTAPVALPAVGPVPTEASLRVHLEPALLPVLAGFHGEAQDLCQRATRALLTLERAELQGAEATEAYDALARALHTLKGTAGTLGLTDLAELAHQAEDVVAPVRAAVKPMPPSAADALLQALDIYLGRLGEYVQDGKAKTPIDPLFVRLASEKAVTAAAALGSAAPAPSAPTSTKPSAPAAPSGAEGEGDEGTWRVSSHQVVELMRGVERLREVRLRLDERRRTLDFVLMQLARLGLQTETAESRAVLMGLQTLLQMDTEELAEQVDTLEDQVKALSTLPVRTLLEPLHRAVRDLCRATGKEAKLSVVGAEVSLDRRTLQQLRGPLVHLVRNAVDHGVETPEARAKRGKHREGALTIRLEQQGNMVFLEVADDGGGLDTERIRAVAVERGVVSAAEADAMDAPQLHQLIFRPGFSTRDEVSETSGRGVGLDVVRNQIQSLKGQVEVQSLGGQGTRFLLTLPVEMGSSPVLLLRCGEYVLGLPLLAVENVVSTQPADVTVGRTQMKLSYRERILALQDLGAVLGVRQPPVPAPNQPLLVLQSEGERLALAVDEVLGERDLVIQPLPAEVRELPAYLGASTLADGDLLLVLRPDWLVKGTRGVEAPLVNVRRALVVDDSLTARAMHRAALEAGGYTVHAASSGPQALELLRQAAYEVVVCDVVMEGMDGYALTAAVRGRGDTAQLPVVLVSTNDDGSARDRALAAGADGFVSKKDCALGRLLSEVAQVVSRRRA